MRLVLGKDSQPQQVRGCSLPRLQPHGPLYAPLAQALQVHCILSRALYSHSAS